MKTAIRIASVIILITLSIVLLSCKFSVTKDVEYHVLSTIESGLVDVVIGRSGELDFNFAVTPWVYSREIKEREYAVVNLYLWAQNHHDYGSITVEIYIDDVLYKSSTASGAYITTEVSGNVVW